MKMFNGFLIFFSALSTSVFAVAAPKFSSCLSTDNKVAVSLALQAEDAEMIDVVVKSNSKDRPAMVTFPCRENLGDVYASYTLLDTEFALLTVNLSNGSGKLSRGQFGSPNPDIDVTCK